MGVLCFLVASLSQSAGSQPQQRPFRLGELGMIITAREQVAVDVERDVNARMTHARLHLLARQSKPTPVLRVDAPGGIEVPQRMQPAILGLTLGVDHTGLDTCRLESAVNDV